MRNVDAHLLEDKMDDAVTHYINSHQTGEHVHVDENTLALNVHDDGGGRVVTVMHQAFTSQMCRQPSVGEQVNDGPWTDVLLEDPSKLAALVAQHLEQQTRTSHHLPSNHKITSMRSDVESSVMLDGPLRLFNSQALDQHTDSIVVQVPNLAPLPPLQDMKRCQDTNWFHNKTKAAIKAETPILSEADGQVLELSAVPSPSPAQNKQQCKKSLPHKKRISKKLKRNAGNSTPQQDIVVLNSDEVHQEEILPDNYVSDVQHQEHLHDDTHHITNGVRSVFICQLCGEYYAEEQFKFFQHLKQHYEPASIIIENPVPDLGIDKITNTCIVDNVSTLPDSIVELSLDNSVPKTMYQPSDKHILYTSSDKTLNYVSNKLQYSMASMEKETLVATEAEKNVLYDTLDKLDFYCMKCNKSFKKQKQCEAHVKEAHSISKLEDMGEFSEPEDLMEGIHVTVEETGEQYEPSLMPHLTVENGHVHQEHVRYWYLRNNSPSNAGLPCGGDEFCPVCPGASAPPAPPPPLRDEPPSHHLKEEVLQRIFEVEVANSDNPPNFTDNIIPETEEPHTEIEIHEVEIKTEDTKNGKKKPKKEFNCLECGRVFLHRNSLLYHVLSHNGKQHVCRECGKGFYTTGALKIHKRVHNGDRPYKCEDCGRDFRQWSDLKYHKVSLHSNQKSFKCDFCDKEFARKYSLNVHRRIHTGERNYKCEYCNKSFRASSYRLSHMRTHTGDKPYKCEECGKCFRVAGDLRRHMQIHDKVRNKMAQPKKEKDNKETKKSIRKTHNVKSKESEITDDPSPTKSNSTRKVAVASTAKLPNSKNAIDKKQIPKPTKKSQIKKLSAPNVTVNPIRLSELQYKMDNSEYNDVEVFDTRQVNGTYSKFKDVYSSDSNEFNKDNSYEKIKDYSEQGIINDYKDSVERLTEEREFATLRPMYRGNVPLCDEVSDKNSYAGRVETTDGKMLMIEKNGSSLVSNQVLSDIRHLEREVVRDIRDSLHGEPMENGFIERLTALYNIQTV